MKRYCACSLLAAAAVVLAAEPTLHVVEADAKKAAIERPAPAYPMVARQLKLKGKVSIEAVVNESGEVADVKVVAGNPVLSKPAVEAVKKWRFRPFEQQGKPAAAVVALSFEFDTN